MVNHVLCFVCYAAGTPFLCHFGSAQTLTRTEKAAKSNHSRLPRAFRAKGTHARLAKSNHSRLPRAFRAKGTHRCAAKSLVSRTSKKFSRKSNYSRTYAKTGGWGSKKAVSDQRSASKKKTAPSSVLSGSPLACPPKLQRRRATRLPAEASAEEGHSPLTPIIPAPSATAALRVVPASIFTTTSRIHVGAPTIWSAAARRRFSRSSDPRAQALRGSPRRSLLRRAGGASTVNPSRLRASKSDCATRSIVC